jgi:hypothetical protein
MKVFKSILDASQEDHVFTAKVEAMINRLEDIFDEHGTPAVVAALICAVHHAKQNGNSEDDFMEFVRSLYAHDFSGEKASSS